MNHHPLPSSSTALRLSATFITVALMTALLVACGGGGGSGTTVPPPSSAPTEGALAASQPGELLAYVKSKLGERQTQRLATPGVTFFTGGLVGMVATTAATDNTGNRSGTVVQEQGVDEDDTIKTDGNVIWTLAHAASSEPGKPAATLQAWRRAADGSVTAGGSLGVTQDAEVSAVMRGMLLAAPAQRAAVIGESAIFATLTLCDERTCPTTATLLPTPQVWVPSVHVDIVNVASATAPALVERWRIDGRLVGSRLVGNQLYLVTQHSPQLAVDALPATAPQADRDALLARLTVADVLPTIRVNGGAAQPLLADTDCFVQPKNASPGIEITAFTVVDLSGSTPRRTSRCFAGGSEALYMSAASLYVATTRWAYTPALTAIAVLPASMNTDLHKFAIGSGSVDYRGSGEVQGHLGWDVERKAYRMSEWNGDLRVLTFTGQFGWGLQSDVAIEPSPARLTILRERASDKTLQVVSTLPNAQRPAPLGKPREQVFAVRFVGNRGYVVTFQRTDPLYVLDLANPADPKTVGELQVTGFSDYLFPITESLLLGVGHDADARGTVSGVKVALIDLGDPAQPRQTASLTFGGPPSLSGLDASRHGIDIFARGNTSRVALPLWLRADYNVAGSRGLQRIEIDAAAKTLSTKPLIAGSLDAFDLYTDRSVQIEDKVYYFSGGRLTAWDW